MMTSKVIRNLYKAKSPAGGYTTDFLKMICNKYHQIEFKDGFMIIGSLDNRNPFKKIKCSCIKSITDLGDEVAVVLNSCIIIFNNVTGKININIRSNDDESVFSLIAQKIRSLFRPKAQTRACLIK